MSIIVLFVYLAAWCAPLSNQNWKARAKFFTDRNSSGEREDWQCTTHARNAFETFGFCAKKEVRYVHRIASCWIDGHRAKSGNQISFRGHAVLWNSTRWHHAPRSSHNRSARTRLESAFCRSILKVECYPEDRKYLIFTLILVWIGLIDPSLASTCVLHIISEWWFPESWRPFPFVLIRRRAASKKQIAFLIPYHYHVRQRARIWSTVCFVHLQIVAISHTIPLGYTVHLLRPLLLWKRSMMPFRNISWSAILGKRAFMSLETSCLSFFSLNLLHQSIPGQTPVFSSLRHHGLRWQPSLCFGPHTGGSKDWFGRAYFA